MFTAPLLEREMLVDVKVTPFMGFVVVLSCVLGLGMSYLSFKVMKDSLTHICYKRSLTRRSA